MDTNFYTTIPRKKIMFKISALAKYKYFHVRLQYVLMKKKIQDIYKYK